MKRKIIAFILSMVTIISVVATPAQALSLNLGNDKKIEILTGFDDGYPMPDIGNMIQFVRQLNEVMYNITGAEIFSNEVFNINVDGLLLKVVDYIMKETGVDFRKIINNLPPVNKCSKWLTTTFSIDTAELQNQLNSIVDKLSSQGKTIQADIVKVVCVWIGVIEECKIVCVPVDGEDGVYQIVAEVTYADSREEVIKTDILYNENTNEFVGKDGKDAIFGFDMDINKVMTFTDINVWQRNMGFCLFYDLFCYATDFMDYATQRIKFNYDNREWMIQMWKGRYFIANGGEVGIYNRPMGSFGTFYNCAGDDDMMKMSLDLSHGDTAILHREPTLHWWVTGFAVSDTAYIPLTMTLVTTITMKDEEMLSAFTKALDGKQLYMDYTVDGLDVTITW